MNYLSLKEAAEFCNYSQEYLSLRARRGKLKAVKFGRNWMTKKEWLDEYLAGAEQYHKLIESKKKISKSASASQPLPPANLPVDRLIQIKFGLRDIRPSLVSILIIALLGISCFSIKENILQSYAYLSPYVAGIGKAGDFIIEEGAKSLASVSKDVKSFSDDIYLAAVNPEATFDSTSGVFSEYAQWLKELLK